MLSEANRVEYFSITDADWSQFVDVCSIASEIKSKDIVILRLYMAMLDQIILVNIKDDTLFLRSLA